MNPSTPSAKSPPRRPHDHRETSKTLRLPLLAPAQEEGPRSRGRRSRSARAAVVDGRDGDAHRAPAHSRRHARVEVRLSPDGERVVVQGTDTPRVDDNYMHSSLTLVPASGGAPGSLAPAQGELEPPQGRLRALPARGARPARDRPPARLPDAQPGLVRQPPEVVAERRVAAVGGGRSLGRSSACSRAVVSSGHPHALSP